MFQSLWSKTNFRIVTEVIDGELIFPRAVGSIEILVWQVVVYLSNVSQILVWQALVKLSNIGVAAATPATIVLTALD